MSSNNLFICQVAIRVYTCFIHQATKLVYVTFIAPFAVPSLQLLHSKRLNFELKSYLASRIASIHVLHSESVAAFSSYCRWFSLL